MAAAGFAIVMRSSSGFPPVYLSTRLTWMGDLDDAATFETESAAQRAFDDAAKNGRRAHFASARVEPFCRAA